MAKITKEELEKAYDNVNIRHLKFVSGEEVIGIMSKDEDASWCLEKPLLLNMAPHPYKSTYFFSDWMPLAKEEVCTLNPSTIISHVECSDDIKERYIRVCLGIRQDERLNQREYPDEYMDELEMELEDMLPDPKTVYH